MITNVNIAPKTVQEMIKWAEDRIENLVWDDLYKNEICTQIYDFCSEFGLNFDVACIDNSSDCYLESTVYVPKLMGDEWYAVVLDCDFSSYFEDAKDFVMTMLKEEDHAQKLLSHFKKE